MQILTPVLVGALLALFTGIQTRINKGRFDAQDRRFEAWERRMDAHEQNNERRFEQVLSELAQLRSDLLQVALAATPRPQAG